ncbi:MAG: protocatechuate 3,4-dioxygenase subunit beta [Actinomycetota bacterium]
MNDDRSVAAPGDVSVDVDPPHRYPSYRSSVLRSPARPLRPLPDGLRDVGAPMFGTDRLAEGDQDLTAGHDGEPQGQRIVVHGRVVDGDGGPVAGTLVEVWQANAGGRYLHDRDRHPSPLDPNFTGAGRCLTDGDGRYRFVTIKPGAYPWQNHENAWRPAHIHFSVFGRSFTQRLVTQMYFPGDPLLQHDPIFNSVPDERARHRLVSSFDLSETVPDWALAFSWDIVLRGAGGTPMEAPSR